MRLPIFSYREPDTFEGVFSALAGNEGEMKLLAGGTDLVPLMKYGLEAPAIIVSLQSVAGLKGITERRGEIFVGAMTSLTDLLAFPLIKSKFPALYQAVQSVAAPPIQNVATLGGNICQNTRCLYYNQSKVWRLEKPPCFKAGGKVCHAVPKGKKCFSVYCGDVVPALIALGSSLVIRSKSEEKTRPVEDMFTGNGVNPLALRKDEIVAGVIIPAPGRRDGSSYVKTRVRAAIDYPLLGVAASTTLDARGKVKKATLVLGAVGPKPLVVKADELFAGKSVHDINEGVLAEVLRKGTQMVDNLALPGSYRRKMLPLVAQEAIIAAAGSAAEKERS